MYRSALLLLLACPLAADEGMWLYNDFPKDRVKARYGFAVTDAFLDHLRLASVKMGASGSFVSPRGLIFTNHHVGLSCVQRVSSAANDYVANGFLAATPDKELQCPGLEVSVLESIEDVTARIKSAAPAPEGSAEANRQTKAAEAILEKECSVGGAQCAVVTLYAGARYNLYRYRRYSDVRLVFAPEYSVGFFGGDPDNFTYPRFCLDVIFLRAYETGKPASTPNYLRWSREGVKEGELVFVSGHPGSSSRLATLAELEFRRDHLYPFQLQRLRERIAALRQYMAQSAENDRVGRTVVFSAENSQKRFIGFIEGLRDSKIMALKAAEEKKLRAAVDRDKELVSKYGAVWDEVAAAVKTYATLHRPYALLERDAGQGSELFWIARTLARLVVERDKPNEARMRGYTEATLASTERRLYSPAPITPSLEAAILAEYLAALQKELGAGDATVQAALAGRIPAAAAQAYVAASRLSDVGERKKLAASRAAVEASEDGLIRLALLLEPAAQRARKEFEDRVEAALNAAKTKVALARFAVFGSAEYPDATATLRLSYAAVKGYRNRQGRPVPYATAFDGLYRRATGVDPFKLPQRWLDARRALDLKVPLNFAGTADTHGGNSGSPTVNTKGEIVGVLFDSNLEKLANEFVFTDDDARSVHVASQGIVEALRKVYKADTLVGEILGR